MHFFNANDQLSERRHLSNTSFSTNQNINEGLSQLNNSCREGETKRRHLLELNPMEDINQRCGEDSGDVSKSQTIENVLAVSFIHSNIHHDFNKSANLDVSNHQVPSKRMPTPIPSISPLPNQQNNISPINMNLKLDQDDIQQYLCLKSGELLPNLNNNDGRLKSIDTFLPHSRSDGVEMERHNKKLTTLDHLPIQTNCELGEEGKITTNRMLNSRQPLSSTGGLNDPLQRKRKSKKFNYFQIFNRTNLVKKFVNSLKNKASKYIFRRFEQKQFEILEDLSADFQFYERNGLIMHNVTIFNKELKKKEIKVDLNILEMKLLLSLAKKLSMTSRMFIQLKSTIIEFTQHYLRCKQSYSQIKLNNKQMPFPSSQILPLSLFSQQYL